MGEAARALFALRFDRPLAVAAYAESLLKCLGSPHLAPTGLGDAKPGGFMAGAD
jgi:hypothetical protein